MLTDTQVHAHVMASNPLAVEWQATSVKNSRQMSWPFSDTGGLCMPHSRRR
jgi:hypothetical protein